MEKVDILVATYNGEKYLREQLDSILTQTYPCMQIIISDDCSTDRTRDILKEYETNYDNITVYYQEKNLGYIKNFEFLMKKVESNYYMLSDQDDIWLPEKVECSVEALKNQNADLVFGDLKVVDENLNVIYPSFAKFMKLDRKIKRYIKDYRLEYLYNCITGCTIISKKEYISQILPFPYQSKYVAHDYWIGLVMALKGKVAYLETPYILYRQHGNNAIGAQKTSYRLKTFDEVRTLFINVKKEIFTAYVQYEYVFPDSLKKQNKQALEYFEQLENKRQFNGKGWHIFHKLYCNETIKYYVLNFMIMNLPILGRIAFNIKKNLTRLIKKENK